MASGRVPNHGHTAYNDGGVLKKAFAAEVQDIQKVDSRRPLIQISSSTGESISPNTTYSVVWDSVDIDSGGASMHADLPTGIVIDLPGLYLVTVAFAAHTAGAPASHDAIVLLNNPAQGTENFTQGAGPVGALDTTRSALAYLGPAFVLTADLICLDNSQDVTLASGGYYGQAVVLIATYLGSL